MLFNQKIYSKKTIITGRQRKELGYTANSNFTDNDRVLEYVKQESAHQFARHLSNEITNGDFHEQYDRDLDQHTYEAKLHVFTDKQLQEFINYIQRQTLRNLPVIV